MDPRIRAAIYAAAAGGIAVLQILGVINTEQQDMLLLAVGSVLDLVAAVLLVVATRKITEDSWSTLRAVLYSTTAAVLATIGLWGLITPESASTVLKVLDATLSPLGMVLLLVATAKAPVIPQRALTEPAPRYVDMGGPRIGPTPN